MVRLGHTDVNRTAGMGMDFLRWGGDVDTDTP